MDIFHVSMLVIKNLCFLFLSVVDLISDIILYSWSVFKASSVDQHAASWSMGSVWSDRLVRSSLRCASLDSRSGSVRLEHVETDKSSPGRRIGVLHGPGVVQQVPMSLYLGLEW